MNIDLERVRANVRQATTDDLIDRATAFRDGMEPEALDVIEAELRGRGVGPAELAAAAEARAAGVARAPDGVVLVCYRCGRPAVGVARVWHRLGAAGGVGSAALGVLTLGVAWLLRHVWKGLPVFPRRVAFCAEHRPAGHEAPPPPAPNPG